MLRDVFVVALLLTAVVCLFGACASGFLPEYKPHLVITYCLSGCIGGVVHLEGLKNQPYKSKGLYG